MTIRATLIATAFMALCVACLNTSSRLLVATLTFSFVVVVTLFLVCCFHPKSQIRNFSIGFTCAAVIAFILECYSPFSLSQYFADLYLDQSPPYGDGIYHMPIPYTELNRSTYTATVPSIPGQHTFSFRCMISCGLGVVAGAATQFLFGRASLTQSSSEVRV